MHQRQPNGLSVDCENIPKLPMIWSKYTFHIPKTFADAKQNGWGIYNTQDVDVDYKLQHQFTAVMSDVKKVDFMFGAPRLVHGIQPFQIEATNVAITRLVH